MKASILDLGYNMKDVLKALERNEIVQILHHGKLKEMILPTRKKVKKKIEEHPFFGMYRGAKKPLNKKTQNLREPRYKAF